MAATEDCQEAALALARYGEAVAHMTHFRKADPAEVIERLGIEATEFQAAQKAWTNAIRDELERGETALALRLGEVFAATRQRLGATNPTLEWIGLRASERAKVLDPPEKPVAREVPIAAPGPMQKAAPSVPLPIDIALPHGLSAPTPDNARSPWVLEGAPAPAPPLRYEQMVPPGMRHFTSLEATQLAVDSPHTPALPFVSGDPAKVVASFPIAPVPQIADSLRETAPSGVPILQAQAIPWDPPPPSAPQALERYAWLCAHLAKAPNQRDGILSQYGIAGDGALRRLHASFAEHFQANPSDGQRWRVLVASYRAGEDSEPPQASLT